MKLLRYAGMNGSISAPPVRVLFLTSLRDVVGCDKNGEWVSTPNGLEYMSGLVEAAARETRCDGRLHGALEIAGVVWDDLPKDGTFVLPWPEGVVTVHIPSEFRVLPRLARAKRWAAKRDFEAAVLAMMRELGADVIVSDHYMARIEFLFPSEMVVGGLGVEFGRVLNIHPAVTLSGHSFCFRGPTPTADAIVCARQNGRAVFTGATFHVVNPVIDDGPVLAYASPTPVYPDDEAQILRLRNYRTAKIPVFVEGMRHYANAVHPRLGGVDFSRPI